MVGHRYQTGTLDNIITTSVVDVQVSDFFERRRFKRVVDKMEEAVFPYLEGTCAHTVPMSICPAYLISRVFSHQLPVFKILVQILGTCI